MSARDGDKGGSVPTAVGDADTGMVHPSRRLMGPVGPILSLRGPCSSIGRRRSAHDSDPSV